MRSLIIDNYDSYTFNLFQLIAEVNGCEPVVLKNDDPALIDLDLMEFDNIVVSPGPGNPRTTRDLGHAGAVLARAALPVLGVCLGHQAIAHGAGASVDRAPRPRHGHLTTVRHTGDSLFRRIPQDFTAVRYHSLCAQEPLPDAVEATAWAEDGVVMALRHRDRPQWGVQFHPESIASDYGRELMANFRDITLARAAGSGHTARGRARKPSAPSAPKHRAGEDTYQLLEVIVPGAVNTEAVYSELYGRSEYSFWLDSSRVEPGLSRFSFLGDASGPLGEVLTYRLADGAVSVQDASGVHTESGTIFDILDSRLAQRRLTGSRLPFDFAGGYVGYFGYELKGDLGSVNRHGAETPDAVWMFADRLIAVDHEREFTHVVALYHDDKDGKAAQAWLDETAAVLVALLGRPDAGGRVESAVAESVDDTVDPGPSLSRDADGYVRDVQECRRQLVAGESYEICLTNKVRIPFDGNDLEYYHRLRSSNPAPYGALLRLGDVTVLSSSPERFLRIDPDRVVVEAKPIKGTAPRGCDPAQDAALAAELSSSAKTRAENLMIVDLLRNDLGRVCEIGTVGVPTFMAVESYATVHQLVSTVRGSLRPEISAVECVRNCFPGGSMTGAPKLRTMEIIDGLETEARGIYSGALGYLGLTGTADLSIVIRTAVRYRDELSIGAGGAIVLDSSPEGELDEMLLKAAASLRALPSAPSHTSGRPA